MRRRRGRIASLAVLSFAAAAGGCSGCEKSGRSPPGVQVAAASVATGPVSSGPSAAPGTRVVAPAPSASNAASTPARELVWVYDQSPVGPMHVVIAVPERRPQDPAFPVLITMHGRGEAFKGPARGARGWIDDYWLLRAIKRLHAPPLTREDFQGFVDAERLSRINESLRQRPYRGLIVVCPYTPDILAGDRPFNAAEPLARFLVDDVLPRVRREAPAAQGDAATGVDGVSLGGRAALLVGLMRPKAFGAVAGLQAAFDAADADELGRRAQKAVLENPRLSLRLLTSDRDFFLRANRAISKAFERAGVEHELVVIPGPHDYEFNRGPGVFEMLLFHDRVLRGESPL